LLVCGKFAQNFLNAKELVYFRLSREKCLSISDFTHDATRSPDIHFFSIVVAQKKFWGTVPSSGHVVCKTTCPSFVVKYARKTKVAYFKLLLFRVYE
jgi:hypothetical protein